MLNRLYCVILCILSLFVGLSTGIMMINSTQPNTTIQQDFTPSAYDTNLTTSVTPTITPSPQITEMYVNIPSFNPFDACDVLSDAELKRLSRQGLLKARYTGYNKDYDVLPILNVNDDRLLSFSLVYKELEKNVICFEAIMNDKTLTLKDKNEISYTMYDNIKNCYFDIVTEILNVFDQTSNEKNVKMLGKIRYTLNKIGSSNWGNKVSREHYRIWDVINFAKECILRTEFLEKDGVGRNAFYRLKELEYTAVRYAHALELIKAETNGIIRHKLLEYLFESIRIKIWDTLSPDNLADEQDKQLKNRTHDSVLVYKSKFITFIKPIGMYTIMVKVINELIKENVESYESWTATVRAVLDSIIEDLMSTLQKTNLNAVTDFRDFVNGSELYALLQYIDEGGTKA